MDRLESSLLSSFIQLQKIFSMNVEIFQSSVWVLQLELFTISDKLIKFIFK